MAGFTINVVGSDYENVDGSSRQDAICRLKPGAAVRLVREPSNPFDPSAVAVFAGGGRQVGYLGEQRTAWIGSKIDRGLAVRAAVERITRGKPKRLIIRVEIEGEACGRSPLDFLAGTAFARSRDGRKRIKRIVPN